MEILIAEDQKSIRQTLKLLLQNVQKVSEVYEVENGLLALELIKTKKINLLILDLDMPIMNGLSVLEEIKNFENLKVIILTSSISSLQVKNVFNYRFNGIILKKNLGLVSLENLIRTIDNDYMVFNKDVFNELTICNHVKENEAITDYNLTKREMEITEMLLNELSNKEIADTLKISIRTVESHRKNIMAKLEVKSILGLYKKFALKKLPCQLN